MFPEIIDRYLNDMLAPQLASFGAPDILCARIIGTVREQMVSCISHWNDVAFRKALLLIGAEEGRFYLPKADDDVRNFVVITVRNSDIESLHADSYHPSGQGKRLTSDDIKAITSAAIKYFEHVDFFVLTEQIGALENDKYGMLAKRYPISWRALTQLAISNRQIIDYDPVPIFAKPNLSNLKPQQAVSGLFSEGNRAQMMQVTADGYSMTIDHGLFQTLQTIVKNKLPFVSDGFKGVSRNLEKLLSIMEYVLGNNLGFITSNYLIANGYAERRMKLVKPGHDLQEMKRNWLNGAGLTKRHRSWLVAAADA